MLRKGKLILILLAFAVLVGASPASATPIPVTVAADFSGFGPLILGVPTTLVGGFTMDVFSAVFFDPGTGVFTYCYDLFPLGDLAGTLQSFIVEFLFDTSLMGGYVLAGTSPGVAVTSIDVSGTNTTWVISGMQAGEFIAIFAQSMLPPGGFSLAQGTNNVPGAVGLVVTPIPEPSTMLLLGSGLVAAGMGLRRRKKA